MARRRIIIPLGTKLAAQQGCQARIGGSLLGGPGQKCTRFLYIIGLDREVGQPPQADMSQRVAVAEVLTWLTGPRVITTL
jgi:hypothetical protein